MSQDRPTRKRAFADGVRAFLPLVIAVIPFGLVFGIVAAGSDMGSWLGGATSFIIFAGAAQLATLQLVDAGAVGAVVIATALVINARHLMYSAALAPAFREFPKSARIVLPYLLTDQAFAISVVRFSEVEDPVYRRWFFTGAGLGLWVTWQVFTVVGIVVAIGIGTYLIRLSFIGIVGDRAMPDWAMVPIRFVAPAVLAALAAPAVLLHDGDLAVSPATNPRALAAAVALMLAWKTKNVAVVIATGMATVWALQAIF